MVCNEGEECKRGQCMALRCKPWEEIIGNECVDKCENLVCETDEECKRGECVEKTCKFW